MKSNEPKNHTGHKQSWSERLKGASWESNLIVGAILTVAGWTEQLTLVGTDSSTALMYVGLGLLLWGSLQWLLKRRQENTPPHDDPT